MTYRSGDDEVRFVVVELKVVAANDGKRGKVC